MPAVDINFLAVLAAAVATMVLGAVWYGVLFGKLWIRLQGYSQEQFEELRQGMGKTYFLSFVCYLVMALVMAILVSYLGFTTPMQGLWLGFLCWLGFAATIGLTSNLFSDRPLSAYVLDNAYQLVYLLLMGVILVVWR